MINFSESGHPVFLRSSALERGTSKSKGKGENVNTFSVVTTKQPMCFVAQSFPSISSVSADLYE